MIWWLKRAKHVYRITRALMRGKITYGEWRAEITGMVICWRHEREEAGIG